MTNRSGRWLWPAVAAISVVAVVVMAWMYLNRSVPQPIDSLAFELGPDAASLTSLSPDGRHVTYGVTDAATRVSQLWLRSLSSLESRLIPGTDGALLRAGPIPYHPIWSPESRSLVFATAGALRKVDVVTAQATELAKIPQGTLIVPGGWSSEGGILFGQSVSGAGKGSGVWRIAGAGPGGPPVQVTETSAGEIWQRPSGFLPDGRRFLYGVVKSSAFPDARVETRIGSIDLAPNQQSVAPLLSASGPVIYAPAIDQFGAPEATGYLLFVRGGVLFAQAFDPARGAFISSTPAQVSSDVGPMVHASLNGRLLYRADADEGWPQSELIRFDRRGKELGKIGPPANYGDLNVFADGTRLAVVRTDRSEGVSHLHIVDVARGAFTRLNPGTPADYASKPGPDDNVAFTFSPEGTSRDIYLRAGNGVGEPRPLLRSDTIKHANDWSPDGKFLIFDDHVPGREQDLLLVRAEGGAPIPFLTTSADETVAQFSPDGKWIVYRTTESGRSELFVRDFAPDRVPAYGTEKVQVSVAGGDKPRWSRDGSEIFFLQGNTLVAVPFTTGRPPRVGAPVALFETRHTSYFPFVVMPGGTFVVNTLTEVRKAASAPLRLLLNWQAGLPK